LDKIDQNIKASAQSRKGEYESTNNQLKILNSKDNVYTSISLKDLEEAQHNVTHAMEVRRGNYNKELERHRYNDQLCQKFAGLVEPLSKFITDGKDAITTSKSGLEDQLKLVTSKLGSFSNDGKVLDQIRDIAKQIQQREITHNEHTSLTVKDAEVLWDQYKLFLQNKEEQIKIEIDLARLRGLTQEDLNEIQDNFRQFDKDENNYLETNELKTCLFSLGEEKSKAQIEELVVKYGDGKKLMYDQFFELMVQVLGDSDTLDEVINGFKLINRIPDGKAPVATPPKLLKLMEQEFVDYIMEHGPKLEDGIDFVAWSQWIFSR